jgi:hypothetical protein
MLNRKTAHRHGLLLGCLALGLLTAPSPGRAEVLYKLETTCTIKGGAPVPCSVEAMNEGPSTLYLHKIGTATETIRVTDSPVRMSRWIPATKEWQSLQQAGAPLLLQHGLLQRAGSVCGEPQLPQQCPPGQRHGNGDEGSGAGSFW